MADRDCFDGFAFGFGNRSHRRGRRFRWRVFERGDLKFVILRMISEKPMHGYEVMQALVEESCGCYKPSPGSVYPTLQMLEDEGYVKSREQDGKKTYEITDEGRKYLEEHGDLVDEISDRISSFADRFWGKDTRDLSASFSRLAQSAFEGAFAWDLGADALKEMSEALDRAKKELDEIRKGHRKAGGAEESGDSKEEGAEGAG